MFAPSSVMTSDPVVGVIAAFVAPSAFAMPSSFAFSTPDTRHWLTGGRQGDLPAERIDRLALVPAGEAVLVPLVLGKLVVSVAGVLAFTVNDRLIGRV